ncbi:hypothetical protein EMMF5_004895 [Cystobasidiomycetes sp. EMM_F5]
MAMAFFQLLPNINIVIHLQGTGFDSGMYPVAANATSYPTWTLNVSTAAPIWYYCKTGTHCQSGMVGAINAPNGTFPMYLANALNTSTALNATMIAANATGSGIGARPIATSSIAPSQALKKQGIRLADDETDEKHDVRSLAPSEATLVAYPHEKTATFKDDKQMAMA